MVRIIYERALCLLFAALFRLSVLRLYNYVALRHVVNMLPSRYNSIWQNYLRKFAKDWLRHTNSKSKNDLL